MAYQDLLARKTGDLSIQLMDQVLDRHLTAKLIVENTLKPRLKAYKKRAQIVLKSWSAMQKNECGPNHRVSINRPD